LTTSERTSPRPKIVRISSKAVYCRSRAELGRLVDVEQRLPGQKLDPQERAHCVSDSGVSERHEARAWAMQHGNSRERLFMPLFCASAARSANSCMSCGLCSVLEIAPMQQLDLRAHGFGACRRCRSRRALLSDAVVRSACARNIANASGRGIGVAFMSRSSCRCSGTS